MVHSKTWNSIHDFATEIRVGSVIKDDDGDIGIIFNIDNRRRAIDVISDMTWTGIITYFNETQFEIVLY